MDKNEFEKLAYLARVKINPDELDEFHKSMGSILDYVSKIQSVFKTEEHAYSELFHNAMRDDDEPHESKIYTDELVNATPKQERGYVKVKKIL